MKPIRPLHSYCLRPLFTLTIVGFSNFAWARAPKCLNESALGELLKTAVHKVDFDKVVDLGPNYTSEPCPPNEPACQHQRAAIGRDKFPQIDLAVIAFQKDCKKAVVGSNVFFSRDFPQGVTAKFNKKSGSVSNVRLQRWTQERFDEGRVVTAAPYFEKSPGAWKMPFAPEDLLNPEASHAKLNYMSTYPASVFKVLVLTQVLRFLDEKGTLEEQLEQKFTYDFGTTDTKDDVTLSIREFLEAMIQWSGNKATAAMIQFLHKNGQIIESETKDDAGYPAAAATLNKLNETFAELGLDSLQMNRTRAKDGLWGNRDNMYLKKSSSVSHISMPSWDVARLLWVLRTNETTPLSERPAWQTRNGDKVDPFHISEKVKKYIWANLSQQLFHEVLSNTLHCQQPSGGDFGIPARMPEKWMNQDQIKLPVGTYPFLFPPDELSGNYHFSDKIAACQKIAEVDFASKTGLISAAGSHAGLVKGIKERGFQREYIVVFNSSLGSRFTDIERLDGDRVIPCFDKTLCYTRRINELGTHIDNALKGWLEKHDAKLSDAEPSQRKTKVR